MSLYDDISNEELIMQREIRKAVEIKDAIAVLESNGYLVVKAS